MTDRPAPDAASPEPSRPEPDTASEPPRPDPSPEPLRPDPAPSPEPDTAPEPPHPAPAPEPLRPEPLERSYAEPIPEPGNADQAAPVPVPSEPRAEPVPEPAAPAQIAPEPGSAPIPFEPEPSVPETTDAASSPPVALEPSTDQTLALPPTTKEVEPAPSTPPPPPPPSGVPVPFAAPPTDVDGGRLALKLVFGIGGGLVLVAAVVIAVVVAFTTFANSVVDKMEDTAEAFIGEVAEEDWDAAYAMLCEDLRDRPAEDYVGEWESWDASGAEVQPMSMEAVEVEVELADGSRIALEIGVDQSSEALETNVCGWRTLS
ncbi:hypothetical protein LO763_21055 [Glycomyces sp. A-F 0318]|uniref:hypothetical protein n=1 Tax=Glycomyces amatae TaxID=2881355 RepID=UPI001E362802|nr:hypothetical protein [Glycomyces amatae]MCD0446104.1 hypothetical protein [Glycomyces amatae]